MIGAGMNGVLGEIALCDVDLTAPTNAASAAHRIEIDAERARGFEQTRAVGELAPLAGGCEDDAMGQEVNRSRLSLELGALVLSCARKRASMSATSCPEKPSRQPGPPLSRG